MEQKIESQLGCMCVEALRKEKGQLSHQLSLCINMTVTTSPCIMCASDLKGLGRGYQLRPQSADRLLAFSGRTT